MPINESDSWRYPWTQLPDYMGSGTPIEQYNKQRADLITQPVATAAPADTSTGTVSVNQSAKSPRLDQDYKDTDTFFGAPRNPNQGIGAASYGGLEDGAGFAQARQTISGSAPQGLPPGVSQLRMDVPADGPKFKLGPGLNGAEMPSVVNPGTRPAGAWGNASGEGPIVRTIGNGLTREAELSILHRGGPLAVLRANQEANMMPLQREAVGAATDKIRAETNKIAQDPGFEGRRVGAIEQEMANRLTLGQGELAAKAADTSMRERLGIGNLDVEKQKVSILGRQAEADIAGKKFGLEQQQQIADLGRQLIGATDNATAKRLQEAMLAMLGKNPREGYKIEKGSTGSAGRDAQGNEIKGPDVFLIVAPDGTKDVVQLPSAQSAQPQYPEGFEGLDKNGKRFRIKDGKPVAA